jgi:hypothetical protein
MPRRESIQVAHSAGGFGRGGALHQSYAHRNLANTNG